MLTYDKSAKYYLIRKLIYIIALVGVVLCFNRTVQAETVDSETISISDIENNLPKVLITTVSGTAITKEYSAVNIEVIDKLTSGSITAEAQIKVRGNTTAEAPKKPYKIKFSKKQNVLGLGTYKNWVLLANAFDKTLIRNNLIMNFSEYTNLNYTPKSKFVDVWVDGVYAGCYLLIEPIEVNTGRVDIDVDNYDFLLEIEAARWEEDVEYVSTGLGMRFGLNEPEIPSQEQLIYLNNFLENAESAIVSLDFNKYSTILDMNSFIDFYIIEEYFKNVDVAFSSTRFYIKDNKLFAGPLWDFDLSSGNADIYNYPNYNNNETTSNSYEGLWASGLIWYSYLTTDDYFMELVKERYSELYLNIENLYEDNYFGINKIDLLFEENAKSFIDNYKLAGWDITTRYSIFERIPDSTYEENVDYLRKWLKNRNEWLISNWKIDIIDFLNYSEYNDIVLHANSLNETNYENFNILKNELTKDVKYAGVTQTYINKQTQLITKAILNLILKNSNNNDNNSNPESGGSSGGNGIIGGGSSSSYDGNNTVNVITLAKGEISMKKGEELQLEFIADIDISKLQFKSSDESIATISGDGIITALKSGTTNITVMIKGESESVTCVVNVVTPSIKLNKSSVVLYTKGNTQITLSPTIVGSNNKVIWKSSNNKVAIVENGVVIAQGNGTAQITASIDGVSTICTIAVKSPKLVLSKKNAIIYTKGLTKLTLTAKFGGKNSKVNWKSSNSKIATVKNGVITSVKTGTITITATVDGLTATCKVTVKKPSLTIEKSEATIKRGKSFIINAISLPEGKVKYKSLDKKIATVTTSGVVKGIKAGTTTIEITCNGIKKIFNITVK